MTEKTTLTKRQREVLTEAARWYGVYDHTRAETAILNRLYEKGFALQSINGTGKWHATQLGRAALCDCQCPTPASGAAGVSESCPVHGDIVGPPICTVI